MEKGVTRDVAGNLDEMKNTLRENQNEDAKRKKLSRGMTTGAGILLLAIAAIVFFSRDSAKDKRKKAEEEAAPHYQMADPDVVFRREREEPKKEEVPFQQSSSSITFNVEDRDIRPPAEPRREEKRAPVLRRFRSSSNPFASQWLATQRQAFTSGPGSEGWNVANGSAPALPGAGAPVNAEEDILRNIQKELEEQKAGEKTAKEKFFENAGNSAIGVLPHTRTNKPAPYTIPSGAMIPCALETGINTDLPGNITAQVTENVYDWQDPLAVLIPQGTKVWGVYDSKTDFGQKRALVKWSRLIFPDGSTLNLAGMPGVDPQGYSGVKDQYNSHINSMLTAAVLVSAFSAVGEIFDDDEDNTIIISGGGTNAATVESAVAQSVANMGEKIFSKFLDRQPTIVIRPGYKFNIQVNADIPFTRVWEAKEKRW